VISASVYIAVCSARNRIRVRLRRLREPRYLVGAIVGVAYFYFAVFARGRRPGVRIGPNAQRPSFPPAFQMATSSLGGILMLAAAAGAWVASAKSSLLDFSQAETEFLFPAPVSRRQLLVHRIIRSQIGSLIASLFISLFATPVSGFGRLRLAAGFWLLLVTMRLYYAGVTLTRARLRAASPAARTAAWIPIGLLFGAVLIVGLNVARELSQRISGPAEFFVHVARATSTGLPSLVLWPFTTLLRTPFTSSIDTFLPAFGGSLLVLAGVTAWVLVSDSMFDAVAGRGGGVQERPDDLAARAPARARSTGWTLPLTGRPELALFWKGATEAIRGVNAKTLRYLVPALFGIGGGTFGLMAANRLRGPASAVAVVAALVAAAAIVFGPQIARSDLRTDFEHLDLLKTWPVRAADVIRGEMAWPVLVVSAVAWVAVVVAALFSGTALPTVSFVSRWSFAIAAAFAGPALIAAQFAFHNTATILFPAWVQLGSQRTRGIDAMGQRLIMLAAVVVSLVVFAIPGALAGGILWVIFHRLIGDVVYVPAAIAFAVVVLVEVLAVTEMLGPAYERIDVTSIERGET
jgi:ABC-2 type transport system permease protein